MELDYRIVDVFTDQPYWGNPLAVVLDAHGLSDDAMAAIAREMNLSETVFLLPARRSECAARVRIFTPANELAFAGHPTIGVTFVLGDEGIVSPNAERFVLEEEIGPVPIRREPGSQFMAWLTVPSITFGETFDRTACAAALGLSSADVLEAPAQMVSAGVPALFVALRDRAAVDRAVLNEPAMCEVLQSPSIALRFIFCPTESGAYSRMFAPAIGIAEDPATGGATGPLAAYMIRYGLAASASGTRFASEQGVKMGRRSVLHVLVNGPGGVDGIEVGGTAAPVGRGTLRRPPAGANQ